MGVRCQILMRLRDECMYAHLHCLAMGSRRWVRHMLHFRLSNEKLDVVAIVTALQDANNFSWPLIECARKAGGHQKEREREICVGWVCVGITQHAGIRQLGRG